MENRMVHIAFFMSVLIDERIAIFDNVELRIQTVDGLQNAAETDRLICLPVLRLQHKVQTSLSGGAFQHAKGFLLIEENIFRLRRIIIHHFVIRKQVEMHLLNFLLPTAVRNQHKRIAARKPRFLNVTHSFPHACQMR